MFAFLLRRRHVRMRSAALTQAAIACDRWIRAPQPVKDQTRQRAIACEAAARAMTSAEPGASGFARLCRQTEYEARRLDRALDQVASANDLLADLGLLDEPQPQKPCGGCGGPA